MFSFFVVVGGEYEEGDILSDISLIEFEVTFAGFKISDGVDGDENRNSKEISFLGEPGTRMNIVVYYLFAVFDLRRLYLTFYVYGLMHIFAELMRKI